MEQTWGTVVITGASSGIGTAFAHALAPHADEVVLVARREDRLRELADRLGEQHGTKAGVIVADLAGAEGVAGVIRELVDHDVDMLVNNAGFATHGRFAQEDPARSCGTGSRPRPRWPSMTRSTPWASAAWPHRSPRRTASARWVW